MMDEFIYVVYSETESHAGGNYVYSIWDSEQLAVEEKERLNTCDKWTTFLCKKIPLNRLSEIDKYYGWCDDILI